MSPENVYVAFETCVYGSVNLRVSGPGFQFVCLSAGHLIGRLQGCPRLGGSTSFHKPPLTDAASVKRMAGARGVTADIRKVLADSGIPETSDAVVAMLSGATSSVRDGLCTDATPNDGVLVDCDVQPGATLEWMAYRPNITKGNPTPGFWDITRRDTFTPAWMLHFGVPLGTHADHPVYFVGEGRLFLRNIDDVQNNYQMWGGVRVHF